MVIIQNCNKDDFINATDLSNRLQNILLRFDKNKYELIVRLVDKAEIQQLNKTYRQLDKPTNVLAFPSDLPAEVGLQILGDVVICTEVVATEAKAQNKTFDHHLIHIAIHGTLHLLGYDHIQAKDAAKMEALEQEILAQMQIKNPYQSW